MKNRAETHHSYFPLQSKASLDRKERIYQQVVVIASPIGQKKHSIRLKRANMTMIGDEVSEKMNISCESR